MNSRLITYTVLVGLTPLIPIPILDDLVKSFFYRSLIRSLASAHQISLSEPEVTALAEEPRGGCVMGCLSWVIKTLLFDYLLKRVIRKVLFFLEWQRAIDLVTHTYYAGYLLEYAFQEKWYTPGDVSRAAQLREAVEDSCIGANTRLVKGIVQGSFVQSRQIILAAAQQVSDSLKDIAFRRSRLWLRRTLVTRLRSRAPRLARWLQSRLRPTESESAQMAQTEKMVEQTLEGESERVGSMLGDVVSYLQEGIAAVPKEHFEVLQTRLQKLLETPQTQAVASPRFKFVALIVSALASCILLSALIGLCAGLPYLIYAQYALPVEQTNTNWVSPFLLACCLGCPSISLFGLVWWGGYQIADRVRKR